MSDDRFDRVWSWLGAHPRIAGALALVVGVGLSKIYLYDVLQAAATGDPATIHYSDGVISVSVILVEAGGILLIGGRSLRPKAGQPKISRKLLGACVVVLLIVLYVFHERLAQLGYKSPWP